MRVKILQSFKDKENGKRYKAGTIVNLKKERVEEILGNGIGDKYIDPDYEEIKKELNDQKEPDNDQESKNEMNEEQESDAK